MRRNLRVRVEAEARISDGKEFHIFRADEMQARNAVTVQTVGWWRRLWSAEFYEVILLTCSCWVVCEGRQCGTVDCWGMRHDVTADVTYGVLFINKQETRMRLGHRSMAVEQRTLWVIEFEVRLISCCFLLWPLQTTDDQAVLIIKNANRGDSGPYNVTLKNASGTVDATVRVTVLGKLLLR